MAQSTNTLADATSSDGEKVSGIEAQQLRNAVHMRVFGATADPIRLGRYTVLKRLGSGGMGVVYAAYDTELDRKVAVKLLRAADDESGDWRTRLRREAQALAKLSHPNVVQVYDVGEHGRQVYVPMEFVEGPNLRQWIEAAPKKPRQVVEAFIEAGRGLAAAHQAGIVHRDFKPENVIVGDDGRVRVLDFGLARGTGDRLQTAAPTSEDASMSGSHALLTPLTREGAIMGTPAYMAPEQHLGLPSDERTDQFSFCVALYEALYGERPFPGRTFPALREAVLSGDVRPAPAGRRVPTWIRRAVLRGLARDPDARFTSMDELLDALQRDPAVLVWRIAAAAVALAVVAGAFVAWQRSEERHAEEQKRLAIEVETERQGRAAEQARRQTAERALEDRQDSLTLAEVDVVLARDPTRAVAMLLNLSERAEAWEGEARTIAADAAHRGIATRVLSLPADEIPQALSSDGHWLVTRTPREGGVHLLDLEGNEPRRDLATGTEGVPVIAVAPDASRLASLRAPTGVALTELPGAEVTALGEAPEGHHALQWADDGARFVSYGRDPEVHVWTVDGQRRAIGGHHGEVRAVSVRGELVATVDGAGTVRLFDLAADTVHVGTGLQPLALASMPGGTRLLTGLNTLGVQLLAPGDDGALVVDAEWPGVDTPVHAVAFDPARPRVALGLSDGAVLWWHPADDQPAHTIGVHDGEVVGLRYTADGRRLVSVSRDRTLAITDLQTDARRVLRGHDGVGFWALATGASELVTVGWEGTARHWPVDAGDAEVHRLAERRITALAGSYAGARDGTVLRLTGGEPEIVDRLVEPVHALAVGRDEQLVASTVVGQVVTIAGGKHRSLHEGDGEPVPVTCNEQWVWAGIAGGGVRRWPAGGGEATRIDTGEIRVRALQPAPDGGVRIAGWTPDGRTWLGTAREGEAPQVRAVDRDGILAVAFDPTSERVAWSKHTRELVLADGEETITLGQHDALVDAMVFEPRGRTLVTVARDGTVRVWDPESGRHRSVAASRRSLRAVVFTPEGDGVWVAGDDERLHFVPDDLPHGRDALTEWIRQATSLRVEPAPIERASSRRGP